MSNISGLTYGQNAKLNVSSKDNVAVGKGSTVFGRIIKSDDSNNVVIKLTNGAEVKAQVEGDTENLGDGLLKFKIVGVVDNQIQMKIVEEDIANVEVTDIEGDLDKFMEKNGINKEDAPILKAMLKYNISLTKDNISAVKSILDFSNRTIENPEEIKQFIETYLNSNNIALDSVEGMQATDKLMEFFNSFTKATENEIMLFIENNIDFSTENLESFNNLFKGDTSINEVLKEVANDLKSTVLFHKDIVGEDNIELKNFESNNIKSNVTEQTENKSFFVNAEGKRSYLSNREIKNGISLYKQNNSVVNEDSTNLLETVRTKGMEEVNKEISNLIKNGELESVVGKGTTDTTGLNKEQQIKNELTNILRENNIQISENEKNIDVLSNIIKNMNTEGINKSGIEQFIKDLVGKDAIVSNESISKFIEILKSENTNKEFSTKISDIKQELAKNIINSSESTKESVKSIISILKNSESNSDVINIMKNTISDLKVYNKLSEQYYYLDTPVTYNENEYPCKLIIKDNRKEGKQVDSKNFKIVIGVKTVKLGTVDSFLNISNDDLNLEIKCEEDYLRVFELSKSRFEDILNGIGFNASIKVTKKENEATIDNCRGFFGENNIAGIDIKV